MKLSKYFKFEILFVISVLFFKIFLLDYFIVKREYMLPNIKYNDIVLFKKYSYGWSFFHLNYLRKFNNRNEKFLKTNINNGDLALFFYNDCSQKTYIKRIIAVEGDKVKFIDGVLHINNKPILKTFIENKEIVNSKGKVIKGSIFLIQLNEKVSYYIFEDEDFKSSIYYNTESYKIPKNHVWVQGDYLKNPKNNVDIETISIVPIQNLVGKPFYILNSSGIY